MAARTIHPFPARMAPDIAIDQVGVSSSSRKLRVLDPMCGSGTVLGAASAKGHDAQGLDIDPLAVLMSRVATQPIDFDAFDQEVESVIAHARTMTTEVPRWDDPETLKFSTYWFAPKQRVQLNHLSRAIDNVGAKAVKDALQVALSRIIVTKAQTASLAQDTSHSRPHRVADDSDYDVYSGFMKSAGALSRLLSKRTLIGTVNVELGDARATGLRGSSIDLTVTSPPYLNAIDYLRGHKMSLIWLGYTIPILRKIRASSIGAERALDREAQPEVESIIEFITASVDDPSLLPIHTLKRYADDLTCFATELHRVSRAGGRVVTVIGNSTLRGNYIENDKIVKLAYENAGFSLVERTERLLPENRRYLPTKMTGSNLALSKRMRTEVVLVMRKA